MHWLLEFSNNSIGTRVAALLLSPFMDGETETQQDWLEHFPRVPRLRISELALGTARVGWGGWQVGRAGFPIVIVPAFLKWA